MATRELKRMPPAWTPAALAAIRANGFPVRRGFGEQVGLELRYWQTGGGQLAEQLSLFGDAN